MRACIKGVIGLLLNGLGVIKHRQDGDVNDRPRRQPGMAAENEFNNRLIMPASFWCTLLTQPVETEEN